MKGRIGLGVALLALAACGGATAESEAEIPADQAMTPAPVAATPIAEPTDYSQSRWVQPIRVLEGLTSDAANGRRSTTPGSAKARELLIAEMATWDAFKTFEQPFDKGSLKLANVIAMYDGDPTDTGPVLVATAHYDHLGRLGNEVFHGADDNASGSGALFAVAATVADLRPEHDVVLAWLDGEEFGLTGAFHLVASDVVSPDRAMLNLNLDMVGQSPDGELNLVGTTRWPDVAAVVDGVAKPEGFTLKACCDTPGPDDLSERSDQFAFEANGMPWTFLTVGEHEHYHASTDTFATIPLKNYEANLDFIAGVTRALLAELPDLAGVRSEDRTDGYWETLDVDTAGAADTGP